MEDGSQEMELRRQRIEELTLYMIEQNKKIERVEEQNNLLMKEVEQLKAK
jgi:uncharacterized coiled-coil protein SlyX